MGSQGKRAIASKGVVRHCRMITPWQKIESRTEGDYRVFKVRRDTCLSPRTSKTHDFFVIESVDWVNVVAVTPQQELVMIEQYRHGSNTVELELPGGMIDPRDASPEAAGIRELREETGYEGTRSRILGNVYPNPAIMSNRFYTVLVEDCQCHHPLEWDHTEDIITRLVPVEAIPSLVSEGKVKHSLVVVALYTFELWRNRRDGDPDRL
jgi:ADP-ribose pyrophosphatase